MRIKKIQGLWAIVDRTGQIVEAYDTKYEAEGALQIFQKDERLKVFDQIRTWISLYDVEAAWTS